MRATAANARSSQLRARPACALPPPFASPYQRVPPLANEQRELRSSVPFTNHARRVLSSQQPTAHARMLERTPVIVFAPLRRACARAIACGGGVVAFVTSRLRCAPGPPPLLRAPPAANAESPPCRIVGCVFGCVLVSHYGEVAVEIR